MPLNGRLHSAMKRFVCLVLMASALLISGAAPALGQTFSSPACLDDNPATPTQTAIAACDQLLRLSPTYAEGWYRRGVLYQRLDLGTKAIESFDEALRLNPRFAEALVDRGVEHVRRGNRAQALSDLSEAIRIAPSALAFYNRGAVYSGLSNYSAAIADFTETLRLHPDVDIANLERGLAYGALRQHREAVADLRIAVQRRPSARAWEGLCWNLAAIEAYEEALSACDVATQLDASRQPFSTRGFINLKLRRYQMALDNYEAAMRAMPDTSMNQFGRGLARLGLAQTSDARSDFEVALTRDPTIGAWYALYGLTVAPEALAIGPVARPDPIGAESTARVIPRNRSPRVALVIGVSTYETMSNLPNPSRDARALAVVLRSVGFDVELVLDPDQRAMRQAVMRLGERMAGAGPRATGLFFFAGHGIQSHGINYLIPSRPQIRREADLAIEAVSADAVLLQMQEAGISTNILILDACRDMPLTRTFRGGARGLAEMRAPRGSFIAYSTAPGDVAEDGDQNSPFAAALISELPRPGLSLPDTFIAVRRAVIAATEGDQIPWDSSSMVEQFYFVEPLMLRSASESLN